MVTPTLRSPALLPIAAALLLLLLAPVAAPACDTGSDAPAAKTRKR